MKGTRKTHLGKMEANSFATLVKVAGKLKIETTRASSGNT
jgi:hypothetical protein